MANIFLISDTHFGHSNILQFKRSDGSPVRSFASVQEMDEYMVEKWNSVVRPQDKVYHLGDVTMHKNSLDIIGRCNGHKRLVRGNHDDHKIKKYLEFFEEVYSTHRLDRFLLSHIPLHPDGIGKAAANIHGHVHNSVPALYYGPRYFNVSVEVIDYTPVALEDLKLRVARQQAA